MAEMFISQKIILFSMTKGKYVDGFVLSVPKKNLAAYKRMATIGKKVWMENGALDYKECMGDDLNLKMPFHFPKMVKLKKGEVIFFSYIVYKSRAHRDAVNAKVMKDKRMTGGMNKSMPFDFKRMAYGGFKVMVGF